VITDACVNGDAVVLLHGATASCPTFNARQLICQRLSSPPDTVLAMPFVVIIMTAAIREIDPSYENAAMGLGANRIQAIVKVI
jgi:ABC-type methionine transport system permease subunit